MERVKSIFLLILIICAIYQLLGIWNFTPNEKYFLNNLIFKEENLANNYYLKPERTIVSFGNKQYTVIKTTRLESNLINEYLEKVYGNILVRKDNFIKYDMDIIELYNQKSIILEYDYDYNVEEFEEIFKIKSDKFAKEVKNIKRLVIVPILTGNSNLDVYIENSFGEIYYFKANIDATELYGLIDEINMFNQHNIYVLTSNEPSNKFYEKPALIPVIINDNSFLNRRVNITNPFDVEDNIENYANIFFENPKAKWKMQKEEDIVIYGDGEKSVRIYDDGYIEYVHNGQATLETFTLDDSIKVAQEFLNKEIYSVSEQYIQKIRKIDDDKYKLYYGNRIDGFNELLDKTLMDNHKLEAPIEITIEKGIVTSYRRIVENINFEQNLDESAFISYDEVLDKVINKLRNEKIEEMDIVYHKQESKDIAKLVWRIEFENETILYDAIRR